ncbi:MAG: Lrp/AsnC family transcriptional regulator [Candidatus Bathyarchaeota archaeon]|jgi:DNA-binding Lrp family transcriptional regulator
MISAFTLVKVSSQMNTSVFREIAKLPLMKQVTLTYGEYDLIVRTETDNIGELNKFIYNILRKIPNITMTATLIVSKRLMPKNKP